MSNETPNWVDEKLSGTSRKGCLFLFSFLFFGVVSIQGCFIGQLIKHHAKLYNRVTEVEKQLEKR